MSKLTIHTTTPPPTYSKRTQKLHARRLRFELDGWPLIAESLAEAMREAKLMGDKVTRIEPEH